MLMLQDKTLVARAQHRLNIRALCTLVLGNKRDKALVSVRIHPQHYHGVLACSDAWRSSSSAEEVNEHSIRRETREKIADVPGGASYPAERAVGEARDEALQEKVTGVPGGEVYRGQGSESGAGHKQVEITMHLLRLRVVFLRTRYSNIA